MTQAVFRELARRAVENYCSHPDGAGECACDLIMAELDTALSRLASGEPPSITCPVCGETVKQVASATLDLALWQHYNWVCKHASGEPPATTQEQP